MKKCLGCGVEITDIRAFSSKTGKAYTRPAKDRKYCSHKCRATYRPSKYGTVSDEDAEVVWQRIIQREGTGAQGRQHFSPAADWWRAEI